MVGLHAEQAVHVAAILHADQYVQRGKRLFRHAADAVHVEKALLVNVRHHKADRVHVGKDHDARRLGVSAGELGNDIAKAVLLAYAAPRL